MGPLNQNQTYISDISVTGLFGIYDYTFSNLTLTPDFSQFITIHGNNGSGKTTILKMISALLSSKPFDGTKSILANIRFFSFEIYLSSGVCIQAERKGELGSYNIMLKDSEGIVFNELFIDVEPEEKNINRFVVKRDSDEDYFEFLSVLKNLNTNVTFISHERQIINSFGEHSREDNFLSDTLNDNIDDEENNSLKSEYKRLLFEKNEIEEWIKSEIRESSNIGIQNSNQIYLNLLTFFKSDDEILITTIIEELKSVTSRLILFSKYDLMPNIEIKSFVEEIIGLDTTSETSKATLKTIYYYFKTISEKIDALEPICSIIDTFVASLNNFFDDKEVNFNTKHGFYIELKNGHKLKAQELSSGEIQIFLILLSALKSNIKGNANIIIIDEPEISLNTTWQRYLLSSFEKIAKTSPVQFILATHSIEMISENYEKVVNLSLHDEEKRD